MPSPTPENATRTCLGTLLALASVAFLHALVYMVLLPHWMGEDEPWHLQNVIMVAEGHGNRSGEQFHHEQQREHPLSHLHVARRFGGASYAEIAAIEDGILDSMEEKGVWRRVDWLGRNPNIESFDEILHAITASNHPPLYYYAVAPVLWLFPEAEPRFQLLLIRLMSAFLFVGTVVLTFTAARCVFPCGPGAMLAALIVALWPMSARGGAVVNNDVLTRFWVALSFYIAAYWVTRTDPIERSLSYRLWPPVALLVVSGLALLTKTSGASTVIIVGLAALLHPASLRRLRGTVLLLLGLGAVVGGGAAYWISSYNPGVTLQLSEITSRLQQGLSAKSLASLRDTLVGKFNWESRSLQPDLAPYWGALFVVLLGVSLIGLFVRRDWLRSRLLWLAWGTSLVQLILMALRGVSKGRYLMPVAPAMAVMLVAGLFILTPKKLHRPLALSFVLLLVAFDGFFVWHGLAREAWMRWDW